MSLYLWSGCSDGTSRGGGARTLLAPDGLSDGKGDHSDGNGGHSDGKGGHSDGKGGHSDGKGGHSDGKGGHSDGKGGYLVALKYYEQQTQATRNFLQWQCLANNFGMKVVEPFIYKSTISFPFSFISTNNGVLPLRFGDLIDMKVWNQQTLMKYRYTSVVRWEEFVSKAPHNIIIVCAKYRNPPFIQVPIPGHYYRSGCKQSCFDNFSVTLKYLTKYGFKMVRRFCANFAGYAGSVRESSFMEDVLGSFRKDQVTVLLNEFRGFYGLYRMPVLSRCGLTHALVNISSLPSPRISGDVHHYAMSNFKGFRYTSVLVRVEKLVLHSYRNVTKCAHQTLAILEKLKATMNLEEVFLAMDVGQFGSRGSKLHHLQSYGETFFKLVYPTKWSFKEWENSFNKVSSKSPAYVANFQRTVAARGDCLVMVGAGGFQAQARDLYEHYHTNSGKRCVYKVCTEPV